MLRREVDWTRNYDKMQYLDPDVFCQQCDLWNYRLAGMSLPRVPWCISSSFTKNYNAAALNKQNGFEVLFNASLEAIHTVYALCEYRGSCIRGFA